MSEANAPAACPGGHDDTVKLLPAVAVAGQTTTPPPSAGGGCCGGACGCG